jgi:heme-degrading monooxygenase HmoA
MVLSVQICDLDLQTAVKVLRRPPRPARVPGLEYAETTIAAPLSGSLLPAPRFRRVALVAAWESDAAFEEFAGGDPLAAQLSPGWQVRLQPLHVYGAWSRLPGLPKGEVEVGSDEPVAVLTLGRPRLRRLRPFLKASAGAEAEAVANSDVLALTGLARPPRLVATFSLWRNVEAMRSYARGRSDGGHPTATRADRANPFHHESAFIRFRPYASRGSWDGRDPLAATTT